MTQYADALRGPRTRLAPGPDVLATIPKFYGTERTDLADKIAHLHFFVGSCDWWLMEYEPETGIAFGWVDLGDPSSAELGYFSCPSCAPSS